MRFTKISNEWTRIKIKKILTNLNFAAIFWALLLDTEKTQETILVNIIFVTCEITLVFQFDSQLNHKLALEKTN